MSQKKKIAVVLSGCGKMDGSEVHEATMALLAIDMAGLSYQCFAPDIPQAKTLNHITSDIISIKGDKYDRNVMVEGARIARGNIKDLKEFNAKDYEAIVFPGGMGAVLNLCDYGEKGVDCKVDVNVEKAINDAYNTGIVIGAMCIAPVLIAKVLGKHGVVLTIGNDEGTASDIKRMGAKHMNVPATEVCVDAKHKIVSTPAYMLVKSIKEVYQGADKMIQEIIKII